MTKMTRQDWEAHGARAKNAAARWAHVAEQHEAEARGKPWHASQMTAMEARDNEARCMGAAAHAAEMAAQAA